MKNDDSAFMALGGMLATIVLIAWAFKVVTEFLRRSLDMFEKWWIGVLPNVLWFLKWAAIVVVIMAIIFAIYSILASLHNEIEELKKKFEQAVKEIENKVARHEGLLFSRTSDILDLEEKLKTQDQLIEKLKKHTNYQEILQKQDSDAEAAIKELTGGGAI